MAFKTFVAGDVLTASEVNTYLMKQAVIVCTAATRPTGTEGMLIVETDTDRILMYTGAAWVRIGHFASAGRTGGGWRRVANQSIGATTTATVSWDTEDLDSDGFITPHATTGTTFTIPTGLGGLYLANFTVDWASGPSPARIGIEYTRSGQVHHNWSELGSTSIPTGDYMGISVMMPLSAADTFQCIVRNGSGGSINLVGWMDLIRIGY